MTIRDAFRRFWQPARREPIPVVHFCYVVRHTRLALYWRDPYKRYANAGDPRSDWTPDLRRAYRFAESHHAAEALRESDETGFVILTNKT